MSEPTPATPVGTPAAAEQIADAILINYAFRSPHDRMRLADDIAAAIQAERAGREAAEARVRELEAEQDAAYCAIAVKVAQEWEVALKTLASDAAETGVVVKEMTLHGEPIHPFYAGKLSILKFLIAVAEDDVKRFSQSPSDHS